MENIYPTKVLKDKYGKPDTTLKNHKIFYARLTTNKYQKINNNYYMKLSINYNKQKIFLEIYDLHFELIDNDYYWDFDTIRKRLSNKIKYLAYITAKRKYENRKVYFFYKDIKFYELKGLDEFLNLIEKGIIKVCFKVGIYKKGKKLGNTYDHGTGFEISKEDIVKLYKRIDY